MIEDDDPQLVEYCALPGCWSTFVTSAGRGRPRRFCDDEHRRQADTMRKRAEARIQAASKQIERDRHLLAALDPTQTTGGALPSVTADTSTAT